MLSRWHITTVTETQTGGSMRGRWKGKGKGKRKGKVVALENEEIPQWWTSEEEYALAEA